MVEAAPVWKCPLVCRDRGDGPDPAESVDTAERLPLDVGVGVATVLVSDSFVNGMSKLICKNRTCSFHEINDQIILLHIFWSASAVKAKHLTQNFRSYYYRDPSREVRPSPCADFAAESRSVIEYVCPLE